MTEIAPQPDKLLDYHLVNGERTLKHYLLFEKKNREEHLFLTDLRVARLQIHNKEKNETHFYDTDIAGISATDTGYVSGASRGFRTLHALMRFFGILAFLAGIPVAIMADPIIGISLLLGGLVLEIGLIKKSPKGAKLVINIGKGISEIEVNTEEGRQAIKEVSAAIRNIQRSNQ